MEILKKTLRNDIISDNRHFEIVLLKKLIYMIKFVIFDNNIVCVDKKNEFCNCIFILSYIKYYSIIISKHLIIIRLT